MADVVANGRRALQTAKQAGNQHHAATEHAGKGVRLNQRLSADIVFSEFFPGKEKSKNHFHLFFW